VAEPSAVAASVVEAGCTWNVVFAMAARFSAAVAGDIVEEVVVGAVGTCAPSHHARPSHSDRGRYPLYSGSEYVQAIGLAARAVE